MDTKIHEGKMKAIRMHRRGGPHDFIYEDVGIPEISGNQVLVRVYAAAITPTELSWNSSYVTRDGKERFPVTPSFEVSGVVEKTGTEVKHLRQGDEVYGLLDFWANGAAAEYVVCEADGMALKPETVNHVEAASLTLSGLTAWQALFEHGKLSSGDRVLIHGAGGGVGSLAIQLAHWKGAHIIGTCSSGKAMLVRNLGADEVIDYGSQDFEDILSGINLVLDTVGGETLNRSWKTLSKGGTIVTVADDIDPEIERRYGAHGISFLVQPNRKQLAEISRLVDSDILKPMVQEVFPLKDAENAYTSGLSNHNTGKIVLKVRG